MDTQIGMSMSNRNGTALATSGDAPDTVAAGRILGPGDYVRSLEDTAPMDVVDGPGADDEDLIGEQWDPVTALGLRVQNAEGRVALQGSAALREFLSDEELQEERELAEWERRRRRQHRRWQVKRELSRIARGVRDDEKIEDDESADRRWHRRAVAARKRVTSPDARLAKLYRRAELSSRALITVVGIGMLWAAFNVQHNLVPDGDKTNPLYWLSFGVESLLSVPLIVIMLQATTAAMWGREVNRGKIFFMEAGLLLVNVGLNTGPHLVAGHLGKAAEFAVAPVMVGVVIWLHAWNSARYAELISTVHVPGEQESGRLGEDTAGLLDLVVRVQAAMRAGQLRPSELNKPGEVAPSAGKIAAMFGIGKDTAGLVRAAVNRLAQAPVG